MATGFGLKPVRHKNGSPYNSESQIYYVPATNTAALGIGEVVVLSGAMDPANVVPAVTQAAANSTALLGVVVGFASSAVGKAIPYGSAPYLPASTAGYVLVCDDPDIIYQVQENNASNTPATAAQVGAFDYSRIVVVSATANANTATGMSKTMLDDANIGSSSDQLQIIGVAKLPGNSAAMTGGAVLEVMINKHVLSH